MTDFTWDVDGGLARVIEQVAAGRVSYPAWRWPNMSVYNGYTHETRVVAWQVQKVALKIGILPWPKKCSICTATRNLQYHNEDYSRPLACYPVCQPCHRVVHKRFRDRAMWKELLGLHGDGTKWFEKLSTEDTVKPVSSAPEKEPVANDRQIPLPFLRIREARIRKGAK